MVVACELKMRMVFNQHTIKTSAGTIFEVVKLLSILDLGHKRTTSKPNRRFTGGAVRFRPVFIVLNKGNRPEPSGTAG